MARASYAALRFAEALLSAGSRFLNAILLDGSTSISISARAALERTPRWRRARVWIDRAFWFDPDHCALALAREAELARKTLAQIAGLKD
jgi:hypothetical protein